MAEPEADPVLSDDEDADDATGSDSKDAGGMFSLGVDMGSIKESARRLKAEEEAEERGEDVTVTFQLPDGSVIENSVISGAALPCCRRLCGIVSVA